MLTKTIAIFTLLAALVIAAGLAAEKAPAATPDEQIECEYVVTPQGSTLIKGGDSC